MGRLCRVVGEPVVQGLPALSPSRSPRLQQVKTPPGRRAKDDARLACRPSRGPLDPERRASPAQEDPAALDRLPCLASCLHTHAGQERNQENQPQDAPVPPGVLEATVCA